MKNYISIFIAIFFSTSTVFAQNRPFNTSDLPKDVNSLIGKEPTYNEKQVLLSFIIAMVDDKKSGYGDGINKNPYLIYNQGLIGENIIDDFIKNTKNLDAKIYGFTPIMIALIKHDYPSMKKLLQAGADPYIDYSRTGYTFKNKAEKTIAENLIICAYNRLKASGGRQRSIINGKVYYSQAKIFVTAYSEWIQIRRISYNEYKSSIFGEMVNMSDYLDKHLKTIDYYKENDKAFVKACRLYEWEKVDSLLALSNVNSTNEFGQTALLCVLKNKDYGDQPLKKRKMVKFLLNKGAYPVVEDYEHTNSFLVAYGNYKSAIGEYKEINKEIYERILSKALDYEEVVIPLVVVRYEKFVKILNANPSININYKSPKNGKTPLYEAIIRQEYEIAAELLKRGAKLSDVTLNPLKYIFSHINHYRPKTLEWVRLMVKNGENVNGVNNKGERYLETAYSKDEYETFKYLFDNGADVNLKANVNNASSIFEGLLFDNKASNYYELTKSKGVVSLEYAQRMMQSAIRNNKTELVKQFIALGADASEVEIHDAVKNNNIEIVKILIKANADLDKKDLFGKTPIKYVQTKEMKALLEEK